LFFNLFLGERGFSMSTSTKKPVDKKKDVPEEEHHNKYKELERYDPREDPYFHTTFGC